MKLSDAEIREMLEDVRSPAVRANFAASARACDAWEREHPVTIEGILDWIDQLRALFGDPPVDPAPWRGDDFRI